MVSATRKPASKPLGKSVPEVSVASIPAAVPASVTVSVPAPASAPVAGPAKSSAAASVKKATRSSGATAKPVAPKTVSTPKDVKAANAAKSAKAAKVAKPAKPAKPAKVAKVAKVRKAKLVRDSFTIPKPEYLVLEQLKQRAGKLGAPIKKSELLRAGIKALAAMDSADYLAALAAVPAIKTGRPAKA
jgi:hypothetical protein